MANVYQTAAQTCHVKSDNYATTITSRLYDHLVKGSLGDCLLSAEGKFIRAHKLILSISSEYFENMFSVNGLEKPIVIMPLGLKFNDLCLILDFAYLGQAQVPHESLDDFLKAGELLQIRGIKERRLNFMTAQQPSMNRSFDSTISSTQETFTQPPTKRARDDDDITIQEASEIMKMLLENNLEIESDVQDVNTDAPLIPPPTTNFFPKAPVMQGPPIPFFTRPPIPPTPASKKKSMAAQKNQGKEKFPCRHCRRVLASKGRAIKHENECNDNPNREIVTCDICNMELKPSALTLHKNNKHGPQKNKFTSPDYTNQPSASPINSPSSMITTMNPEPTSMTSPVDPLMTMSPQPSIADKFIAFKPASPMQIIKVEKVELKRDGSLLQMTEITQ